MKPELKKVLQVSSNGSVRLADYGGFGRAIDILSTGKKVWVTMALEKQGDTMAVWFKHYSGEELEEELEMKNKITEFAKAGGFSVDPETRIELLKVDFPAGSNVCEEDVIDWLCENTYYDPKSFGPASYGNWYLSSVKVDKMVKAHGYAIVEATIRLNV